MSNVVVVDKSWALDSYKECPVKLDVLHGKDLTRINLDRIQPKYIFFPHYSQKVPPEIFNKFECVGFHMTDLPFGRGGHPLQNLIARQIYQTKISAFRITERMDAGPIYLKHDLSLEGKASEIYHRVSRIIFKEMIPRILEENPVPKNQGPEVVQFSRRTRQDNNISNLLNLNTIFDYIRMLDADDYPSAFLETSTLTVEFSNAVIEKDHIVADAIIRIQKNV